jgi:hypothetical protein
MTLAEAQQIAVQVMRLRLIELRKDEEPSGFDDIDREYAAMIAELEAAIAKLEEAK